jgi:Protein of unknwon function (DUF3310)
MINEFDLKHHAEANKALNIKSPSANDKQIGGNHYKQFAGMEPWDVITAWNLGYLDGTALKYIARWKSKNGVEDLRKAIHFLEKAIEVHSANPGVVGYMALQGSSLK